ncbi:Outer membrane receptor for ferric coprogen and ferric-rhodotorulic acid [Lentimonas sp. CC19]|nr:Outer membrane receptor for ferric coprogen and ferric-rhodotorulic acid [Lentimonas sp. CC10]CAA6696618.1 Outer membrane receptor for ferric coprogen and ferric-rhodotorulic acid [Lentimonas sp. CC19]CAA7071302.1 Outer membrane receptor for ferric coprogen and ferric-rhodotorulic acid [Lentimonas sp. CC11]
MNRMHSLLFVASATASLSLSAEALTDAEYVEIEETTLQSSSEETAETYAEAPVEIGTGLNLNILETPQSITVISREQMDDFALTDINDVLDYTPGISVEAVETDRTYFTARGFDITNFQIDGLGLPLTSGNIQGTFNSVLYEEIQVLRGANGLGAGTGNPSATINLIRKRPTADLQGSIDVAYGSWDTVRLQGDVSGALNDEGTVRGRFVTSYQDGDSYIDLYSKENIVLYGVVEMDLSDQTMLTIGHSYEETNSDSPLWGALPVTYSNGNPTDYDVDTTTAADWSYWDKHINNSFLRIDQILSDTWTAQAEVSYIEAKGDSELFYMYGSPDQDTGLGLYAYPSKYESTERQILTNLQVNGLVDLFDRAHEVTAGFSYSKSTLHDQSDYGQGIGTPISVPLGQWKGKYPKPAFNAATDGSNYSYEETSVYGATRLNLADPLKVILGARVVWGDTDGYSYGAKGNKDQSYDSEFVPYAGVLYDINETFTAYASYTEIFTPQSETDIKGSTLDPIDGEAYEAGIKANFFENKAYASLAIFHIEQDNVAEAAGMNGGMTYYEAVPGLTSEGIEFEVAGELFPGFRVLAGYTYQEIRNDDDDFAKLYTPKNLFKVSTTYLIPNTKLTVGAAARWQSETKGGGITQDDYTIVDLMAKYQFNEHWSAQVNINNLTDEKYYSSLYWTQAFYGAERNAEISMNYSF